MELGKEVVERQEGNFPFTNSKGETLSRPAVVLPTRCSPEANVEGTKYLSREVKLKADQSRSQPQLALSF